MVGTGRVMSFDGGWPTVAGAEEEARLLSAVASTLVAVEAVDPKRTPPGYYPGLPLTIRWGYTKTAWSGYTRCGIIYISELAFNGLEGQFVDCNSYLARTVTHEMCHWFDERSRGALSFEFCKRSGGVASTGVPAMSGAADYVPGNLGGGQWPTTKNGRLGQEEDFADSVTAWVWGADYEPDVLGRVESGRLAIVAGLVAEGAFGRALTER